MLFVVPVKQQRTSLGPLEVGLELWLNQMPYLLAACQSHRTKWSYKSEKKRQFFPLFTADKCVVKICSHMVVIVRCHEENQTKVLIQSFLKKQNLTRFSILFYNVMKLLFKYFISPTERLTVLSKALSSSAVFFSNRCLMLHLRGHRVAGAIPALVVYVLPFLYRNTAVSSARSTLASLPDIDTPHTAGLELLRTQKESGRQISTYFFLGLTVSWLFIKTVRFLRDADQESGIFSLIGYLGNSIKDAHTHMMHTHKTKCLLKATVWNMFWTTKWAS